MALSVLDKSDSSSRHDLAHVTGQTRARRRQASERRFRDNIYRPRSGRWAKISPVARRSVHLDETNPHRKLT